MPILSKHKQNNKHLVIKTLKIHCIKSLSTLPKTKTTKNKKTKTNHHSTSKQYHNEKAMHPPKLKKK